MKKRRDALKKTKKTPLAKYILPGIRGEQNTNPYEMT